ncbi:MAG: UDP-N-acetylmuramoyl-tripeptide--D-alanyl-D-alanine ligase [Phycisphaerales bacterium JB060]
MHSLAELLNGSWLSPGAGTLSGASIDTRTLEHGQAFFAIPGSRVDGHDYLPEAFRRGASVAIVEREVVPPASLAVLQVRCVREALWDLAQHYRSTLRARVIAVMGSNGKTTTVRMLAKVLGQTMASHASARSFNNALGLPLTILNCPVGAEALVCELGEGERGALARYTALARPDVAVVTSIGRAHVGELGGMEAVRREFQDALETLRPTTEAYVPDALAELHKPCRTTFSAVRADIADGRTRFELADGSVWSVPVVGLHNAGNAAAVIAVARHLGVREEDIAAGLDAFEPADMRLAVREIGGATVLVDCYNANPDSMAAALRTLELVGSGQRRVAVLGDMLELGPDSETWHREMGVMASAVADHCVFIGPASKHAFDSVANGAWFATVAEAGNTVCRHAQPGTVVLVKASRGMAFERLLDAMQRIAVA